ncbi:MAG: hypothetical protein OEX77_09710 [Candidatus Bathyarchaeota archaeon]|nr:hypothetical protein [Candidatus Bathyarchaeota archaeon]MDH5734049.1 hypothetical protein [Candidatus Bathyarchaeota archaeon]
MTLVNPPAFEERVKTYGSPKAAVEHLLNSGFSPEEIEWKIGIPCARFEGSEGRSVST